MSMPHSFPRVTRSVSNASMSRIVFIVRPFPLAQSSIIRAFSGTSQITVLMAAGKTNGPKLINRLCSYVQSLIWSVATALQASVRCPFMYLCRWCSRWPLCRVCRTKELPPGSMCNRPALRWSTERENRPASQKCIWSQWQQLLRSS